MIMSLIQTCVRVQVNQFDYLVAIQRHTKQDLKYPDLWLPWNYKAKAVSRMLAERTPMSGRGGKTGLLDQVKIKKPRLD